ncbi:MAG: MFS transporter, partial [Bacteroidota bacterium]
MSVHQRNLLILCFTIFLAAAGWNMILPFLPLFLGELGVKTGLAQWSSFIFAAQSLAAIYMQPFWGRLGDRVGRKPMIVRAGLCLAGIYFLMSACRTPIQLATLRFLNGALTGFIPGSFALIATNTPEEVSGRYVATAQSASAFGSITGPVFGSILAGIAGYRGSMRLCGIIVLSATMLVLLLVREERRPAPGARSTLLADV